MSLAWQGSLFTGQVTMPDASFAACARNELAGGAWVDHAPGWLAGSDDLFTELVETAPWRQRQRRMYEKVLDEPRLTAWWGAGDDAGLPGVVADIRTLLSGRYGVAFDSVGCNLYRDGRDSVAWHGDTVRKRMAEPLVAIVSLGEPRRFLLRPRGGGPSRRYDLGAGDLLVMGGTCQHTWEHCVPKVRSAGARLSVTFRHSEPAVSPG
ncbi:MAG: putative alkylated repair protein [Acidimicrobiales bacterium]|nr:putative alkylated repair protein [Acidimicrobiales bacterium]